MNIYRFENPEELEVLRSVSEGVAKNENLQDVLGVMFKNMHDACGIGLAAPQVGVKKRFFIVEVDPGKPLVFINPQIIGTGREEGDYEEGCLSLPGLYDKVRRPLFVKMQATNERGRPFTIEAEGLLAVCLQHEYSHLDGELFIDRLNDHVREKAIKRYKKLLLSKKGAL